PASKWGSRRARTGGGFLLFPAPAQLIRRTLMLDDKNIITRTDIIACDRCKRLFAAGSLDGARRCWDCAKQRNKSIFDIVAEAPLQKPVGHAVDVTMPNGQVWTV